MATSLVNIRSTFQARKGFVLIDVDYEQIENRLSAALAGEYPLLDGFQKGYDFYRMVYRQMTGGTIALDAISKQQRQIGKIVTLGQNYGQGAKGAARRLQRALEETKAILESYWQGLPATRMSKEKLLRRAREEGGLRTWFGRWRALPELKNENPKVRARAERQVWNMLIQGTAADWLKTAMIRCDRALSSRRAHMLLTVHDELLFEVDETERLAEIAWLIKDAMEFKIPDLPIDQPNLYPSCRALYPDGFFVPAAMSWGWNWGEQHDLEDKTVTKEGVGKVVPGFRTLARQRGLDLDFDTFDRPTVDYLTIRRPVGQVARPLHHDEVAELRHLLQEEPMPNPAGSSDPYRYPCVIVKVPPLTQEEAAFLAKAARSLPGQEYLYLEATDGLVEAPVRVESSLLMQYLRKLPRVGADIRATRYGQDGQEVKVSFSSAT